MLDKFSSKTNMHSAAPPVGVNQYITIRLFSLKWKNFIVSVTQYKIIIVIQLHYLVLGSKSQLGFQINSSSRSLIDKFINYVI